MFQVQLRMAARWLTVGKTYESLVKATLAFRSFCELDGQAHDVRILKNETPVRLHYAGESI
jgi:hypothetical protein